MIESIEWMCEESHFLYKKLLRDGEDSEYIEDDDEGTNDENGATEEDEDLVDVTHDDEVHVDGQFGVDDEPFFGVEDGSGVEDTD
ncbi:hypothetical protein Pfo_020457 [Paulownia fortunei]|nr:hypothetical protein Pfo_020457 [Paulownia fortunei]